MKMHKLLYVMVSIAIVIASFRLTPVQADASPHIEILLPHNGDVFSINSTITLVANITDADSSTITYFLAVDKHLIDSGNTATGKFTQEIKIGSVGEHIISLTVLDENSNYDVAQITVNIINHPPTVKILSPGSGTATTATNIILSITASDIESSSLSFKVYTNQGFSYTGTIGVREIKTVKVPLWNGKNIITASVSDGYSETSTSITIFNTPLLTKIISPHNGKTLPTGKVIINARIDTEKTASYMLLVDNQIIKTGTTTGGTISATVMFTATGKHIISIIAQSGTYTASDSVTIYITEKPQVFVIFPKVLESGLATLNLVSNMDIDNLSIFTDNIHVRDISHITSGTTTIHIQTQLMSDMSVHTITIKLFDETLVSATFTATGSIPHIYNIGTPTKTNEPHIYIYPTVDTASNVYIYVGDTLLGDAPQTFTPSQDGTYTIKVNAIGGNNYSIWKTQDITFIWPPIISVKNAYWTENKLTIEIEITDYDKDTDMITLYPIELYYPIHMTNTTQVFTVDIPESYITVGSTLTIEAHDTSGLTSTITFTIPGKIPAPHIVSPDPSQGITIFQDTVQVTVEVSATGTIYWYQDGLLTKKQPAPKPGRYTYMFFTDDVKKYEIYAKLCNDISCSPNSETLIVHKGVFVKLWVGKDMYFSNGKMGKMDVSPFIDPRFNRTVVPIRFVGSALGYNIEWNPQTRDVILKKANLTIIMNMKVRDKTKVNIGGTNKIVYVGSATVTIKQNDHTENINLHNYKGQDMGEPIIVDSRTFVPVRFLSEILGAKVTWEPKTKSIGILLVP